VHFVPALQKTQTARNPLTLFVCHFLRQTSQRLFLPFTLKCIFCLAPRKQSGTAHGEKQPCPMQNSDKNRANTFAQ
jgi:hypothetical protein